MAEESNSEKIINPWAKTHSRGELKNESQDSRKFSVGEVDLRSERDKIADILGSKIEIEMYGRLGWWEYSQVLDEIMVELENVHQEAYQEGFDAGNWWTLEEIEAQITGLEFEEENGNKSLD